MNTYLIRHGNGDEAWLCQADDADHAVEQFINAEIADPDFDAFMQIVEVYQCEPVEIRMPAP